MKILNKRRLRNAAVLAILTAGVVAQAAVKIDTSALREAVTLDGVRAHRQALQDIADANGSTRRSGSSDYDASAQYVANVLTDAGYEVSVQAFLDYFASQGLATEPTVFDGRSDYGPFIGVGIPAGGLFTGTEEIKTEEQVAIYGGTAGEQYDPCYHLACDTFDNVSEPALDQMSDAVAHSVMTFAMTTSAVNGTDKGKGIGRAKNDMDYLGSHLRK